jgi:hypothetical protein
MVWILKERRHHLEAFLPEIGLHPVSCQRLGINGKTALLEA